MSQADIQKELQQIQEANEDGVLRPEDVVEFAADAKTALHSKFTWDNGVAAHQYRLWQAREVIRVTVIVEPRTQVNTRAFVSLESDRTKAGGGYRDITAVLSEPDHRAELLGQCLKELKSMQKKYSMLSEMAREFDAIIAKAERAVERAAGKATAGHETPRTKGYAAARA